MKHKLFFGLTMLGTLSAVTPTVTNASSLSTDENTKKSISKVGENSGNENGIIGWRKDMKEIVKILSNVEAFVFLEKDDERDLKQTFGRTDKIEFNNVTDYKDLLYEVGNNAVAEINYDTGEIKGIGFGETIIKITNPKDNDNEHYFLAFVCPKITVKTPEGVVYSYPKMYNHRAKITFTASDQYMINTVLRDGVDITEKVAPDKDGKDDGYYLSSNPITDDATFVISEESVPDDYDGQTVVGSCGLKVYSLGSTIYFKDTTEDKDFSSLSGRGVHLYGPAGIYHYIDLVHKVAGEDDLYYVNTEKPGVFRVEINDVATKFKVLVEE